ncbi:hypothetical protein CI109_100468 [Kwoniella shandongensis]|uniref:Uncharacterized protein n=1 Tax=Kwoniella shandongensis TaxID=1734106 RepID=A0A5M6C4S1_9TREE|nr:uncharacterized protein CI109_001689 [Kwoniella shandongensis]KAA5529750.1 hypothetical protein CI109_001689 [Kwoniella shandongensis]
MARDPPSLLASSELRDISLQPTAIRSAKITIVHPQLRDLILPLARGRILYPRGPTIEEQRWLPSSDEEDGGVKRGITGSTRPLLKLDFVPNCLTASQTILACGGQHGELYICDLPQPHTSNPLTARFTSSAPKIKPFAISTTLPGRSINNSIIIPPSWPGQWTKRAEEGRLGYVGRGSRKWEEADRSTVVLGRTEGGDWVTRRSTDVSDVRLRGRFGDEIVDSDEDEEMEDDDDIAETEIYSDDEEEMDMYETASHSPASSVATYPNTVPFLHAPRIPHLPNPARRDGSTSSRREGSFSSDRLRPPSRDRTAQQVFSLSHGANRPAIQYVTSRSHPSASLRSGSMSSTRPSSILPPNASRSGRRKREKTEMDEPRILISNNDCTVKVFSLRPALPNTRSQEQTSDSNRAYDTSREVFPAPSTSALRQTASTDRSNLSSRPLDRLGLGATAPTVSSTPPHLSRFGWEPASPTDTSNPFVVAERETELLERDLARASGELRAEHEMLRREEFERVVGIRVGGGREGDGDFSSGEGKEAKEQRRLSRIGGTRFRVATNHSSLSPDLKTMVSVGDSTEVSVFEVIDGGRDFRKIAVYNAATDAGFSTSWSKDGRKFAVASQDGQVTVWDHRSSQPLAIFHTSADQTEINANAPSFLSDVSASYHRSSSPTSSSGSSSNWDTVGHGGMIVLRDPVTGTPRTGSSTSGKEAARVVKFSPEGSTRDLMVFSEENSNIHIIDARTFNTHVIIPVPYIPSGSADPDLARRPRMGVEGGTWGIAGVGFDPSGDWLYSGTERTVVEWDLRRLGGGQGGTWGLA